MPPAVDTFPLELLGYIIAAGISTEVVILLLTEFCQLPNPFVLGAANTAAGDHDTTSGRGEASKVKEG